ncbi:putative 2-phosphosulfolactate phosphatase [Verrucomicrobiota bacterium]|nr:putative 2-phosphosulfolactate phosphatase [Verrucomicrobiota bacterium]
MNPTAPAPTHLEVLFTPADFAALAQRDLRGAVCVVFDVLRATSSMLTALDHGARGIIPVGEIAEAIELKRRQPDVLLAGERDGLRISRELTGSLDFDLGNSPREFTRAGVGGRTLVMTTTNGTRALRACAGAGTVLIGSFLNLPALTRWLTDRRPAQLFLVCSGTHEEASYEDTLAAGALCARIWPAYAAGRIADSAAMARELFKLAEADLLGAMAHARNGRRLLAIPELRDDVPLCLEIGAHDLIAQLDPQGTVRPHA